MGLFSKMREKAEKEKAEKMIYEKSIEDKFFKGFRDYSLPISFMKDTFDYYEKMFENDEENILISIVARYDYKKFEEYNGLLIITDKRLLFVSSHGAKKFHEQINFKKINGIEQKHGSPTTLQLILKVGRTDKVFSRIGNKESTGVFAETLEMKIAEYNKI